MKRAGGNATRYSLTSCRNTTLRASYFPSLGGTLHSPSRHEWTSYFAKRSYTGHRGIQPLELHHHEIRPPPDELELPEYSTPEVVKERKENAVVVLHGLFGSHLNWRTVSKAIAKETQLHFYLLDLRNHGASPWSDEHSTEAMVADVRHFIKKNVLPKFPSVNLIGHSMGGKVAMSLALQYPDLIRKLTVVDVAPINYASVEGHQRYIDLMRQLDLPNIQVRGQIDKEWMTAIPEETVRSFLLSNLVRSDEAPGWKWKINLDALERGLRDVRDFNVPPWHDNHNTPQHNTTTTTTTQPSTPPPPKRQFKKPTFFVGGGESDYIPPHAEPHIAEYFPHHEIVMIPGAGHWVHFSHPNEFVATVSRYLSPPIDYQAHIRKSQKKYGRT